MLSRLKKLIGGRVSDSGPVSLTAQRFLQLFEDHGVAPSQIPRLLPGITLASLGSTESLLASLTPELLDRAAKFFGIRPQWLEGVDDQIYEPLFTYKEPRLLLEHLAALVKGKDIRLTFPIRILTTTKQLDRNSGGLVYLAPVLVERVTDLGDEAINRYHVYQDGFDWSHLPARIELKAIARIAFTRLRSPVSLFVISEKEMKAVLEGRTIPHRFLNRGLISTPSLEDFAISTEESRAAKDCDELPEVFRYIEANKLQEIPFELAKPLSLEEIEVTEKNIDDWGGSAHVESPPISVPPIDTIRAAGGGRRAENDRLIWEPVRTLVKSWLQEDASCSITDAIDRVHRQQQLRASRYTDSAIRKQIASLWPSEARKPGRKPKKSP